MSLLSRSSWTEDSQKDCDGHISALPLCERCHKLELTIDDFLVPEPMPLMSWPNRYRGLYDAGLLYQVVQNATNCSICQLLLVSLGVDMTNFGQLEDRYKNAQCRVLWSTNDRLTGSGPHGGPHVTRALTVSCEPMHPLWHANAKLELHEKTFPLDEDRLFLGRDVSEQTQLVMVRSWLDRCGSMHSTCSMPTKPTSAISNVSNHGLFSLNMIRLIDCEDWCITEVSFKQTDYLTLSYVWGGEPPLKLLNGNKGQLETKDWLSKVEEQIPLTARHAMKLTKLLGYRYIWVDSLCIIQDSKADKATFIPKMNNIYHRSQLTIVAAEGDSKSGLRGFAGKPRLKREATRAVGQGLVLHAPRNIRDSLNRSTYATRAWTFQEQYLSRRCLFFLPDQAFFECQSSTWREDKHLEDDRVFGWPMAARTPIDYYVSCVKNFAPRCLTYTNDVLDACAGMMNAIAGMGWRSNEHFPPAVCGIPTAWFEYGLIWHMQYPTPRVVRRSSDMPSWAWTTWQGPANIFETMRSLRDLDDFMARRWIKWVLHIAHDTSKMLDITTDEVPTKGSLFHDQTQYPPVAINNGLALASPEAFTLCSTPARLALHFSTLVVDVFILQSYVGWYEGYHVNISSTDSAVGFCQLDDYRSLQPKTKLTCALICPTTHDYARNHMFGLEDIPEACAAYHVIVIEEQQHKKYVERIGVGFVTEAAIKNSANAVWRQVWVK